MNITLWLVFFFAIKHFIIDFTMQGPYQYLNKGTYGHSGGILHSGLHVVGTFLILCWFTPLAWLFSLIDGVAHYHIDWAKMNINKKFNWGPTTSEYFWWLVGLDQFLHLLTYIVIISFVV